jgi:excisionase family DNA binding protein
MPVSPKEIDSAKLYTVTETARILAVTDQTVRKHLTDRRLIGKKVGRRWLVKGSEIQKFIGE